MPYHKITFGRTLRAMLPWRQVEKSQRTDRIRPSMDIQIILAEDVSALKSKWEPLVRHCGDEIQGNLKVVTRGNFDFEIHLSFEGLVRTWIGFENERGAINFPPTTELQFLQVTQKLCSHPATRSYEDHLCTNTLPFQFVVPHELISAHSDVHSGFLKLCPSTKAGLAFCDPRTGKTYRQPTIIYMITIKHIRTEIAVELICKRIPQREVVVMPQAPAAPPLAIEAFSREYRLSSTRSLKQRKWGQSLGMLQISAAEPSPLNLLSTPRPSTFASMSLVFTPNHPCNFDVRPCEWTCVVKSYLRISTFYSVQELNRAPTFTAARSDKDRGVHENKMVAEVREFPKFVWSRSFRTPLSESNVSEEICHWTTTLTVPVSTTKPLLPTFLNVLSARRYALVLRLSIKELYHGVLELVLPVQLIYDPLHNTGSGESEGQGNEIQNDTSPSISRLPYYFQTPEIDVESLMHVQSNSPPAYDM